MNLSVNIAGVTLKNPVTVASGTFGSGMEYGEFVDLNKLGAVNSANPQVIEEEVCINIDDIYWTNFSHLLITFGRNICHARSPKCESCPLNDICKFHKG